MTEYKNACIIFFLVLNKKTKQQNELCNSNYAMKCALISEIIKMQTQSKTNAEPTKFELSNRMKHNTLHTAYIKSKRAETLRHRKRGIT